MNVLEVPHLNEVPHLMRKWLLVAAEALCILMIAGCGKMDKIRLTSFELTDVTPRGLRGIKAGALIGVENPSATFTLNDIYGSIYYHGIHYVDFTADPVTVKKRSSGKYEVKVEARLADGISLLDALPLFRNADRIDPAEVTLDVNAWIRSRGVKMKVNLEQECLDKIINMVKAQSRRNTKYEQ